MSSTAIAVELRCHEPHLLLLLSANNLGKLSRHNSLALLDCDDLIDGKIAQSIHLAAWPGDLERVDFCALPQTKMDARIAGRHIARAALGLCHVGHAF